MTALAADEHRQLVLQAQASFREHIVRARGNLAAFIQLVGRDENGDPIELDYLHKAWIVHVNYAWSVGKHAFIMAPFNSGKTSTLAIPLAAFLIGQNPQIRIKIVCADDDMAKLRVASIKSIIESYEYRLIFPGIRPGKKWDMHDAFVERVGHAHDPTVQARGVLTEGIGSRCDVMIMDDVCTQKNSEKPAMRVTVKKRARGTWMSRLDGPNARVMGFGTAWAQDDYTAEVKQDPKWLTLVQAVEVPSMENYEQTVWGAPDVLANYPQGQTLAA